jgi:DNA-binding NtrC family response regulator
MKEKFDGLVEHLLSGNIFLQEAIELLERNMIQRALERTAGNRSAASKRLGIHRNTLQRKMAEYGLGNTRVRARRKPVAPERRPRTRKAGAA